MICRRLLSSLLLLLPGAAWLLALPACSSLPRDAAARREAYEQRLARLDFPTTRQRLNKVLRPAAPPRPLGRFHGNLISGRESFRLDADFVMELSVIYKGAVGASDLFDPSRGFGSQVRAILDTTRSIENLQAYGSPNDPGDIVRSAKIVHRPLPEH